MFFLSKRSGIFWQLNEKKNIKKEKETEIIYK